MASMKEKKAAAIAAFERPDGTIDVDAMIRTVKKDPRHVLYREFEWDVDKAAMAHWRAQARRLISECRSMVTYFDKVIAVPTYVSDPRSDDTRYVSSSRIKTNKGVKKQIMEDELSRIKGAVKRAHGLAVVFGAVKEFEEMLRLCVEVELKLDD